MSIYITERFASVNMNKVNSAESLVGEVTNAVGSLADMAHKEELEPVWSDAKIGAAPEDAMLRMFEDANGTYITVPMVGRRD